MKCTLEAIEEETTCTMFRLTQDAYETQRGWRASALAFDEVGNSYQVTLYLPSMEQGLLHGDTLAATSVLKGIDDEDLSFYWSMGIVGTANVSSFEAMEPAPLFRVIGELRRASLSALASAGGEQAGLMQALVCGYVPTMDAEGTYEDYKTTGLAHIVAVSGSHLALVAACVESVLRAMRVPRFTRQVLSIAFVLSYLVFSGLPISAIRAAVMTIASLLAFIPKRRSAALNALSISIIAFMAHDPLSAVSASFVLSAGATLGIVILAGLIDSWMPSGSELVHDAVVEPFALTIASAFTTMPYSAAMFSQFSIIAPLANILAAPFFTTGCVSGLVASLLACANRAVGESVAALAAWTVKPMAAIVSWLADIPYACICVSCELAPMVLLSIVMVGVLWAWWPTFRLRQAATCAGVMSAVLAVVLLVRPMVLGDALVMLDVGQGDAILVRSGGSCLLIDTGTEDALLRKELGEAGVLTLDAVVITHPDDDHCGSLSMMGSVVNIRSVVVASDLLECGCDSCVELRGVAGELPRDPSVYGVTCGDVLRCGAFTLEMVWPRAFRDEGGNADSVCLLLAYDSDGDGASEWSALLTGDAESSELHEMMADGSIGAVDVLKVGHHGSSGSLDADLMDQLRPRIGLVSVGAGNRYGHPDAFTLETLEEAGCTVFRTDTMGTVTIRFDDEELEVFSEE